MRDFKRGARCLHGIAGGRCNSIHDISQHIQFLIHLPILIVEMCYFYHQVLEYIKATDYCPIVN